MPKKKKSVDMFREEHDKFIEKSVRELDLTVGDIVGVLQVKVTQIVISQDRKLRKEKES